MSDFSTFALFTAGLAFMIPVASAFPQLPAYGAPAPGYGPQSTCQTTSTCSAVYHTSATKIPYEAIKTITVTEYKPEAKTTQVPSTYIYTSYIPETHLVTETVTLPTTTYSITTICTTSTVPVAAVYETCKTKEVTNSKPEVCTATTEVPSIWTTSTPCVETTTTKIPTYSTSICTETMTTCATSTACAATPKGY